MRAQAARSTMARCATMLRASRASHMREIVVSDRIVAACDHRVLDANDVQLKDLGLFLMTGFEGGAPRLAGGLLSTCSP